LIPTNSGRFPPARSSIVATSEYFLDKSLHDS
jgi:hypothetical protein